MTGFGVAGDTIKFHGSMVQDKLPDQQRAEKPRTRQLGFPAQILKAFPLRAVGALLSEIVAPGREAR